MAERILCMHHAPIDVDSRQYVLALRRVVVALGRNSFSQFGPIGTNDKIKYLFDRHIESLSVNGCTVPRMCVHIVGRYTNSYKGHR